MKKLKTRDKRNLKIVQNNTTQRVTIPKGWRKILGIKENTEVQAQLVEDKNGDYGFYLKKKK